MQKIFELLFDQLEKYQSANPGQRPLSPYLEALGKLPPGLITQVLGGFSQTALQAMATARGFDPHRKRAVLEQDLIRNFYDINAIKRLLEKLSPLGREGLFILKRHGGIMTLESWRATMFSRYGSEKTNHAQYELVSSLLIFHGTVTHYGVVFNFPYKNEIVTMTSAGYPIYLVTHPKVLGLFNLTLDEEVAFARSELPQPYAGTELAPTTTPGFDSLLADLVTATRYFEQNKVKALVSGEPGKRDYVKLNDGLTVKEPGDVKAAKKMDELGRLYYLWTLLKETQLVTLKKLDETFQASRAASEEFFAMPRYRQARLLLAAWTRSSFDEFQRIPSLHFYRMTYYETSLPDTQKVMLARLFLISLLDFYRREAGLQADQWIDFPRMIRAVKDLDINFLVDRDAAFKQARNGYRYEYDYDPVFPTQGYFGDEYYSGFTSTLKEFPKSKGGFRLPDMGYGAPLKLSEDFALVEGEWLAQVFAEPLNWLGLAELGRDEAGRPVAFRLTDLGLAALADQPSERERQQTELNRQIAGYNPDLAKALLVQPNFDVMVMAPLENLALLRQVDRFAEQTSMGDVALYRISKDSVLRGLRNNLAGPEIVAILKENNRVPVASNVVQSIEDWASEFERLVLYENYDLLETPDAATLDRLMIQPNADRYVIKRLGPTLALVQHEAGRLKPGLVPSDTPYTAATMHGMPLYFDYRTLQPGSVTFDGPFLIKVPMNMGNPYLLYRLGQFAELETFNQSRLSATFRLTAKAGQRAQQQGLTFTSVITFLEMVLPNSARKGKASPDPISPETLLALKGWLGYYSPLQTEQTLTLQATQADQLHDIFRLDEFQGALLGWAGPNVALVREDAYQRMAARLLEFGMPVKAPGEKPSAEPETADKPKRGRRGSEETAAERERKAREKTEAEQTARPELVAKPGKRGGSYTLEMARLLEMLDEYEIGEEELERLLIIAEETPELLGRRRATRTGRKNPWDY